MFSDATELYPLSALLHDRDVQKLEEWQGKGIEYVELPATSVVHDETKSLDPRDETDVHVRAEGTDVLIYNHTDESYMTVSVDAETVGSDILPDGSVKATLKPGNVIRVVFSDIETSVISSTYTITCQSVVTDETLCPLLTAMWERIALRVNEAYYDRFIAAETIEQWQRHLQVLTDRIALRYERALRMYAASDLEGDVSAKTVTTYDVINGQSSKSRSIDTPDTEINESSAYAGSTTENSGENTQKGTVSVATEGNGGILSQVNDNIEQWRDLETELVGEYAKCFLSTVWY